jgi:hypothetical protein
MSQIKVRLKPGTLSINIGKDELPKGTCKNCGQLIYWLKILSKNNKIQVSKTSNGEYIAHSLTCPTVAAFEEKMRRKEYKNNKKIHANT